MFRKDYRMMSFTRQLFRIKIQNVTFFQLRRWEKYLFEYVSSTCEVDVSSTCNIICFRFFLRRFFPRGADVFLREPTLLLPSSRVFTRNNRAPVYIYLDIYSCANIYFAIPVTHQRTKASFNDQIVELAIMSGRDPRHGPPL